MLVVFSFMFLVLVGVGAGVGVSTRKACLAGGLVMTVRERVWALMHASVAMQVGSKSVDRCWCWS